MNMEKEKRSGKNMKHEGGSYAIAQAFSMCFNSMLVGIYSTRLGVHGLNCEPSAV